ncbi:MAG: outer membrane protein transport protein [Nitrosomonas sp.]|nr:outer membrane protein transport protein [Nitrosomonas sp.]
MSLFTIPSRKASYLYRSYACYLSQCLFWLSAPALSAGIAVMEQSVKELGQAFSGAPVNIDDGSMVFFNPGAMNQIRGKLISVAGYVIAPSVVFQDSSSHLSPSLGGMPILGNNGGDLTDPVFIPNFYYVHELTERLAFGFGANVPFGMRNSYHPDWKGRYQAIDSEIMTLNINPSLSLRLTEKLSFGAGFNAQYLHAKLTNAIDFGAICFQVVGTTPCANQGLSPQAADGYTSLKGDSIGIGYNFGAFYAMNQDTHFGVSYRSRIAHDVRGRADFSLPDSAVALVQGKAFIDSNARTAVTLPDNILLGFSHRFNSRWRISADALWTNWSLIQELRTNFASAQPDDIQHLKWKDTWRYAFGINYFSENNKWVLRSGFAYDQTPVPDSQHRLPRIPDSDRFWLTAGFTHKLQKNIHIHGAYAHLFLQDSLINRRGPVNDFLVGQYSAQINIIGFQMDLRF